MNKLKMESKDMTHHNIEQIEKLFPQVITEVAISNEELGISNNADNSSSLTPNSSLTRKAVDFEKLKLVLSAGTGDYVVADDEPSKVGVYVGG